MLAWAFSRTSKSCFLKSLKLLFDSDSNVFCSCKDVDREAKKSSAVVFIQKGELRE